MCRCLSVGPIPRVCKPSRLKLKLRPRLSPGITTSFCRTPPVAGRISSLPSEDFAQDSILFLNQLVRLSHCTRRGGSCCVRATVITSMTTGSSRDERRAKARVLVRKGRLCVYILDSLRIIRCLATSCYYSRAFIAATAPADRDQTATQQSRVPESIHRRIPAILRA